MGALLIEPEKEIGKERPSKTATQISEDLVILDQKRRC